MKLKNLCWKYQIINNLINGDYMKTVLKIIFPLFLAIGLNAMEAPISKNPEEEYICFKETETSDIITRIPKKYALISSFVKDLKDEFSEGNENSVILLFDKFNDFLAIQDYLEYEYTIRMVNPSYKNLKSSLNRKTDQELAIILKAAQIFKLDCLGNCAAKILAGKLLNLEQTTQCLTTGSLNLNLTPDTAHLVAQEMIKYEEFKAHMILQMYFKTSGQNTCKQIIKCDGSNIVSVSMSPNNKVIAVATPHGVYLYNYESGKLIKELNRHEIKIDRINTLSQICFKNNQTLLIGIVRSNKIVSWNYETNDINIENLFSTEEGKYFLEYIRPDGKLFCCVKNNHDHDDGNTFIFRTRDKKLIATVPGEFIAFDNRLPLVAIKNQSYPRGVFLYDYKILKHIVRFETDSHLLCLSNNKCAYQVENDCIYYPNHSIRLTNGSYQGSPVCASFNSDSSILALQTWSKKDVYLWNTNYQSVMGIGLLKGCNHPLRQLLFSPDDSLLIGASDDALFIWELADQNTKKLFENLTPEKVIVMEHGFNALRKVCDLEIKKYPGINIIKESLPQAIKDLLFPTPWWQRFAQQIQIPSLETMAVLAEASLLFTGK